MDDPYVRISQEWLNATYGSYSGWVPLTEDGVTGWQTMYGLRRALQVELGVSPLASGFGDATRSAYRSQVGRIDQGTTDGRLLLILSCALWCKGSPGLPDYFYDPAQGDPSGTFDLLSTSVADLRGALGLGTVDPHVDVKMMAWLVSMDTYKLISGGTTSIQNVQRWLNKTYAADLALDLVATNGLFTRSMQIGLMIATQLEIGIPSADATGTFGPETRGRLRSTDTDDPEYPYYRGAHFLHLFQAWLTVNGYPLVVDGDIGPATISAAQEFQTFMALTDADYMSAGTWMALMVSCGDVDRPVTGFDYALQLTALDYQDAWAQGLRVVGRYLSGVTIRDGVYYDKFLDIEEINALKADPARMLDLLPIYQVLENDASLMTYSNGYDLGVKATQRAHVLGLPENSIVYFAVDFDAYGATITGPVMDHFRGINDAVSAVSATYPMRVGIYGARNVCDSVVKEGLAVASFVAGATYGWSANMGYPMPASWHFNQIQDTHITLNLQQRNIDKVAVSPNAEPVSLQWVQGPPPELDGRESATGFSLDYDWFIGAVHDVEREFTSRSSTFDQYRDEADDYLIQAIQFLQYNNIAWQAFAPFGAAEAVEAATDALVARELQAFNDTRDARHFAAAMRGHVRHGAIPPDGGGGWTLGDLGGWGLDLYTLWVKLAAGRDTEAIMDEEVYDFVASKIGTSNEADGFGWLDLVADADALLVADGRLSGMRYVDAVRGVLSRSASDRIGRFYDVRFAGDRYTTVDATVRLATNVDDPAVSGAFTVAYNLVCDPSVLLLPKPTTAQAHAMGLAFADYLDGI